MHWVIYRWVQEERHGFHGSGLNPFARQFFIQHLTLSVSVLDCGCGPRSMALSIASLVASGRVVGIDVEISQIVHDQLKAAACHVAR